MPRAAKPCTRCGDPAQTGSSLCPSCHAKRTKDRGNPADRGYGPGWERRRQACLRANPVCTRCHRARATVADHYPRSRDELVLALVEDPDAPEYLRSLCPRCHSIETAKNQPGGWARRG